MNGDLLNYCGLPTKTQRKLQRLTINSIEIMATELLTNPAVWKAAIGSIGKSPVKNEEDGTTKVDGLDSDTWVTAANYYAVQILGLAGVFFGIISFFELTHHLADLMSIFVILAGILVSWQKTKLQALGDFRGQHNALRSKVETFHQENLRLKALVDGLAVETQKLHQVERALDQLATTAGKSVNALVEIVEENGKLQKEIHKKLDAEVTMNIMTAVLHTDRDQDFCLNPREVNMLIMRLKNIPGVEFHEEMFRHKISTDTDDLTLTDACAIVHDLKENHGNDTSETPVFSFSPRLLLIEK